MYYFCICILCVVYFHLYLCICIVESGEATVSLSSHHGPPGRLGRLVVGPLLAPCLPIVMMILIISVLIISFIFFFKSFKSSLMMIWKAFKEKWEKIWRKKSTVCEVWGSYVGSVVGGESDRRKRCENKKQRSVKFEVNVMVTGAMLRWNQWQILNQIASSHFLQNSTLQWTVVNICEIQPCVQ